MPAIYNVLFNLFKNLFVYYVQKMCLNIYVLLFPIVKEFRKQIMMTNLCGFQPIYKYVTG